MSVSDRESTDRDVGASEPQAGAEASGRIGSRWAGLDGDALARAWCIPSVEVHGRIGSTSHRAAELVVDGAASWTVVVADEQTRGRGRRGSTWRSPAGAGLWMSVVLRHDVLDGDVRPGRTRSGGLPLLIGLACAEGIESLLPKIEVGIKWPNDLLVGGSKVGGILCEAVDDAVVAGIGINVADAPDIEGVGLPPTALEIEAGTSLERGDLAEAILRRLRLRLHERTPFHEALPELRRRDVLEGRAVETEQEGPGRASGVDASGALVLIRDDGSEVRVVAGGVRLSSTEPDRRPRG